MKITSLFISFLRKTFSNAVCFMFPPQCPYCETIIERTQIMCDSCFRKIRFITGAKCHRCGRPLPLPPSETNEKLLCLSCLQNKRKAYDLARSVFVYDFFSRDAILKLKYADRIDLRHFFVNYMLQAGIDLFDKTDLIIPVPLSKRRRLKRKYNQAGVLGDLLAKRLKKPYSATTLIRIRHTKKQENISRQQRENNVKNAFFVTKPHIVRDKHILLIDDVLTTGSTADACAKTLKKAGAKAVYILTIAQVVKE